MRRFAPGALVIAVMCQTPALTQPNNARDIAQDAARRLAARYIGDLQSAKRIAALGFNAAEQCADDAADRAVHAGTVAYAAPFTGFGTLVILDHGRGAFTLYGHLSQALVTNGVKVGRNDVVGRAGRTPTGTPAAYFELRVDGRPVDPVQWLRSPR